MIDLFVPGNRNSTDLRKLIFRSCPALDKACRPSINEYVAPPGPMGHLPRLGEVEALNDRR